MTTIAAGACSAMATDAYAFADALPWEEEEEMPLDTTLSCPQNFPSETTTTEGSPTDQELLGRYCHVRPDHVSTKKWLAVIRAFLASGMEPDRWNVLGGVRLHRLWQQACANAKRRGQPAPALDMHRIAELGEPELLWRSSFPHQREEIDPVEAAARAAEMDARVEELVAKAPASMTRDKPAPKPKPKAVEAADPTEVEAALALLPVVTPREASASPAKPSRPRRWPFECFGAGPRTRDLIHTDETGEWFWAIEDTEEVVAWLTYQARQEIDREDGGSPFFGGSFESRLASAEIHRRQRLDRDYPAEACVPTQDMTEVLATPVDIKAYRASRIR